jgi:colanic acid/amylovoran biosynthesis glycosyltransferase
MRIAYLVNQYPKPSHAFIRREIAALEELGIDVCRYSLRRAREGIADPADARELERTRVVLEAGTGALVLSALWAVARPWRFATCVGATVALGKGSERGLLRHVAYLLEAAVLARWLRRACCEHLHAHFGTNSAVVAMLAARLAGVPFSFTAHGPEEFDKPGAIGLRRKVAEAAFVVAVSSFGRSQLYRHCEPHAWNKVRVVPCGLEPAFLKEAPAPVPDGPRLVCVGRLCEQKGQLVLVEAVRRLRNAGVPCEVVLVGDGEMRVEVERAVADAGLEAQVRITGWASEGRVREEIEAARALVLPSFAEGLPVVLMESLALGRPVISTFVAGIPELVVPGECGWLVPAGSAGALAEAMAEVLSADPERLTAMGARGAARVRERHDVRQSARLLARSFGWREDAPRDRRPSRSFLHPMAPPAAR